MLGSFRALAHGPFDGTGSTSAGIACTPATEERRSGEEGTGERSRALIITGCEPWEGAGIVGDSEEC